MIESPEVKMDWTCSSEQSIKKLLKNNECLKTWQETMWKAKNHMDRPNQQRCITYRKLDCNCPRKAEAEKVLQILLHASYKKEFPTKY